jgi:hypothetical protein
MPATAFRSIQRFEGTTAAVGIVPRPTNGDAFFRTGEIASQLAEMDQSVYLSKVVGLIQVSRDCVFGWQTQIDLRTHSRDVDFMTEPESAAPRQMLLGPARYFKLKGDAIYEPEKSICSFLRTT